MTTDTQTKSAVTINPLVKTFERIVGTFTSTNVGRRTVERSHAWADEAAAAIEADPGCQTEWLKLADRLEEEDNPAHVMIRTVWQDDYKPVADFSGCIYRGGKYQESGERCGETRAVRWHAGIVGEDTDGDVTPGLFVTQYENGGRVTRRVGVADARERLSGAGRRCRLFDLKVDGVTRPTSRVVPAGTAVAVYDKAGKLVAARHIVQDNIPVPAMTSAWPLSGRLPAWPTDKTMAGVMYVVEFFHMGYTVRVDVDKVAVS
jgi:hypothetical protein